MSEENVRAFRDVIAAYNSGDKGTWTKLMDPELETFPVPTWPEPGPITGPDAAWEFYEQFEEMLAAGEPYEITELIDAGERVLVCLQAPMRGRASGAEVDLKLWGVHTFRAERLIRMQWFTERAEALNAAGLSE